MTIDEIHKLLKDTREQLNQAGINDLSKLKLERLILDLETELIMRSFDPLRDISNMTVVDVSQLEALVPQVRQVIKNEQQRIELVTRITRIAKTALKGAGLPIPS
jgi:hypothetical protein